MIRGRVSPVIVAFLLVSGLAVPQTIARFTDSASSTGTASTETLDPPTSLTASGGVAVTLSWTPTVDAFATGYGVYRAATSGGPYSLVSSVTPGTATTTTDNPGAGTWYYVLRSTFLTWSSVDSNQASAAVATSTAFMPCVTTAADTSGAGDNNGYELNPARLCNDNASSANDAGSGTGGSQSCGSGAVPDPAKDRHRFSGFVFALPGAVTSIDGIRVRADVGLNNAGGTTNLCAQMSWDAGTTWTPIQSIPVTAAAETTYVLGSTSDTWGHSWTTAELSPLTFRVRIIDASSQTTKTFRMDYLAVGLTYTP